MKCPCFVEEDITGTTPQCFGLLIPFEPSSIDQSDYCTTGRHRSCPLFRNASSDLSLAVHREVARAVG